MIGCMMDNSHFLSHEYSIVTGAILNECSVNSRLSVLGTAYLGDWWVQKNVWFGCFSGVAEFEILRWGIPPPPKKTWN